MRWNAIWRRWAAALSIALAGLSAIPAGAAEQITLGNVGQASANLWPVLIGLDQGFYTAEDLKVDVVYVQSSAALVQQVTAGSLPVSVSTGLADPLRAVGMGAPISIVRLEVQMPPYDLVAKPNIASLADLKGKLISLGGPKDITRIYVERMLAPNGVKPGDFDMVFAGATAARASALAAGAVDAAILLPAFNFQADRQRLQEPRPHRRLCQRPAVLRHGREQCLGRRQQADAGESAATSRTRASPGSTTPRITPTRCAFSRVASGLSEDDVEKAYALFPQRQFFRADRKGLAHQAEQSGESDGEPRRSAGRPRCQ